MSERAAIAFPLGVADPDRGVACIGRYDGGVEMLRLSDGGTVWMQTAAVAPIAIAPTRVLVRTAHRIESVLALALLDARDGSPARSPDVVLPHGIDTRRRDFAIRATVTEREFLIRWSQRRRYGGGAYASAEILQQMRVGEVDAGIIRIDIESGTVWQEKKAEEIDPQPPARSVQIGDEVYELTDDLALKARDAASGVVRWRRELAPAVIESPPPLPM